MVERIDFWFTELDTSFRTVMNETNIPFKIMHRKDDVRKCLHFSIEFANLFYIKLCTKIYTLIKWIEMNNGSWVSGMYTCVDFINFLDLIFNLFIYLWFPNFIDISMKYYTCHKGYLFYPKPSNNCKTSGPIHPCNKT